MSSQANPFVTTQPGYSSLPSAQYNSDDSDSDGAARRGVRKHNTGKYKKPSIATISSELRKTGRKAGCNRLLIFLLYVITLFSVFSLHRNIYENGGMEEKDVKVLTSKLQGVETLLHSTIKEISRFNRTVTNGELIDEVKELESELRSQNEEVKKELAKAKEDVRETLDVTVQRIDGTVEKAQREIGQEVTEVRNKVDEYKSSTQDQFNLENNFMLYQLAGTFTLIGGLISMWHVTSHLRNFHNPVVQRKILAILWMAPIYSTSSWFSLVFVGCEAYLSIIKDCYEAYVVYVFLSFLISVLGNGDREAVVDKLAARADHLHTPWGCGCFFRGARDSDRAKASAVLLQCQVYALQFVLFKPLLAIASFCVNHLKIWGDPKQMAIDYRNPQVYVLVLTNLSVSMAFFGLLKFYHTVQDDLSWCRPWPKFLCIKGVVFMTFWQGLAIGILARTTKGEGSVDQDGENGWAKQAQSFLICIEMLIASIAHFYVFPHYEWEEGYIRQQSSKTKFGDSLALRDFFGDLKIIMGAGSKRKKAKGEDEDDDKDGSLGGSPIRTESEGSADDIETGRALERIRQSLSLLEEDQKSQLDDYAKRRAEVAASRANLGVVDETSTLLVPGGGEEDRHGDGEEKLPPPKKTGMRTKHFRPRSSRLHR